MFAIGKFTSGHYVCIMLDMRLRILELMAAHEPPLETAYALWNEGRSKRVKLPMSTAHRLVAAEGKVNRVDMKTLDALCKTLGCKPSELLARD